MFRAQRGILSGSAVVILTVVCSLLGISVSAGPGGGTTGHTSVDPIPIVGDETVSQPVYAEDELVVKLAGLDSTAIQDINSLFGTEVRNWLPQLEIFLLTTEAGADIESLSAEIGAMPTVLFAHPNYLVDPLQPVQGSYPFSDDDFIGSYPDQTAAVTLALSDAHAISTGAGVTVAVIDGGVDYNHSAFNGTVVSGYDYVDDDFDAFDEPGGANSGHGTFVAGVIHLVAPEAQIRAYRVSEISGESHGYLVAEAIMQAIEDGCQIINLSLVMTNGHSAIAGTIEYAKENDILVTVAAGNAQLDTPLYPACDSNVLAVAAVDSMNRLADFSRYGEHIDVCAPGVDIYSPYQDSLYAWWSGTSFAAPFVAGEAALIISNAWGVHTWNWVRDAILSTAINLDDLNPDFVGLMGSGLIDPVAAMAGDPPPATAWITYGPDSLVFEADSGSTDVQSGYVFIFSSNSPAAYTVSHFGSPEFTTIQNDQGVTNDTVLFWIDPTDLLPGMYADTVRFWVNGTTNSPFDTPITLIIQPPSDSETAYVMMDSLDFYIEEGSGQVDTGWVTIYSTNAPAYFTATIADFPDFMTVLNDSGFTNEIVYFTVAVGTLTAGTYWDTLEFYVEGVVNNPVKAPIALTVYTDNPIDSCWVEPAVWNMVVTEGQAWPDSLYIRLNCTVPGAAYTTSYLDDPDFLEVVYDSGTVNTWIYTWVDPTGLAPGVYADTVLFSVDIPYNNLAVFTAYLTVLPVGADDTAWLYPETLYFSADEGVPTYLTDVSILGSSNAPAAWYAVQDPAAGYMHPIYTSGQTDDSVVIYVSTGELPAGTHYTYVDCFVEGVPEPSRLSIVVTIEGGSPPTDSAWLSPDTLFLSMYEGEDSVLIGRSYLSSSNAPADYYAYVYTYDVFFELLDTVGQTNDSVGVIIFPALFPAGVYQSRVVYDVDGVEDSILLPIILTIDSTYPPPDSAWLSETVLYYEAEVGSVDFDTGALMVFYTGDTTPYTAEVIDGLPPFVSVLNDSGYTGEPLLFDFSATGLSVGTHVDTIQVLVWVDDEIFDSLRCSIMLTVQDSTQPPDSAWISPDTLFFFALEGDETPLIDYAYLTSSNAPAPYHAYRDTDGVFFEVLDTVGLTNDSVGIIVYPSPLPAGVYQSSAMYVVDSTVNTPWLSIILTIDSTSPGPDSAWLSDTWLYCEAQEGSIDTGSLGVYYTGGSTPYTAEAIGGLMPFLSLLNDSGFTGEPLHFQYSAVGLPIGSYADTIAVLVWVDGEIFDSLSCSVLLTVQDSTPPPPTAWLTPDTLFFNIIEGDPTTYLGCALLSSINAPAGYHAIKDTDGVFINLRDTVGQTNDSVGVWIRERDLGPGTYETWAAYFVDSVATPAYLTIRLTVESATPDSAWFQPDSLFFSATLGQPGTLDEKSLLLSTNAPALWFAYVVDTVNRFVSMVDTAGYTDDSLGVWVTPSWVGLGTHYNTVLVNVAGTDGWEPLTVCLTITGSDSSAIRLTNFPNPFNPITTIRFYVDHSTDYTLTIYNVMGQEVARFSGSITPGEQHVTWDASQFASGVYLYRLETEASVNTRKMLLLK